MRAVVNYMVLLNIILLVPSNVVEARDSNLITPSIASAPLISSFVAANLWRKSFRVLNLICHQHCVDDCDVRFKCAPFTHCRHCVEICDQVCSYS